MVGTKIAAMPEVIFSDDYGFLVEPADPKDLAKKILMAMDKDWNNRKISKYAKNFTWKIVEENLLNVYKES